MADGSAIEWTDATWQPITGCSVVSPGCTNCYAMKLAGTRLRNHPSRFRLTHATKAGPVWNGKVRFNREWLAQPLAWKRPRRIFVCAHGDLFHEFAPNHWIDAVMAVMAMCPQHTFQVLTKRAERMRRFMLERWSDVTLGDLRLIAERASLPTHALADMDRLPWPLPNVWLGVSVEDRPRLPRVDELRATPAAVRFLSCEPLLEDLPFIDLRGIGWVIAGGESGPGARPMHPDWARSLRDQCAAARVPFFFKQWGEWAPENGATIADYRAGRLHEWPHGGAMSHVGKKRAGRTLDGREWNEFPRKENKDV